MHQILVLISWLLLCVDASFMQWSRPMPGPSAGPIGSAAGINVFSYSRHGNATWQTDITSASTGALLLTVAQNGPFDSSVVITPSEGGNGYFTCQPLYTHPGEGVLATQPLWCGVMQLSNTDSTSGAHIILPNATIVPLLMPGGAALPWGCSVSVPCVVRSQELRAGQLGGCHRRSNSSAAQTGPTDFGPMPSSPPQSTHVTIGWNGTLFMFRPLVVAAARSSTAALALIAQIPLDSHQPIDSQVQYISIAYPMGADRQAPVNSEYVYQCLVCALAVMESNGTVVMYDSDRDGLTGLPHFTTVTVPGIGDNGLCTPSIESAQRLLPCFNKSVSAHPAIYKSTLVMTCATKGTGYLFDFQVGGPGVYPAVPSLVGNFSISVELSVADLPPGTPLNTDTVLVLVQPYTAVHMTSNLQTSSFSPWYSYAVGITVSNVRQNSFISAGLPSSSPAYAAMTFASSVGSQGGPPVTLTQQPVGKCTIGNLTTSLSGATNQSVTGAIGWISASFCPITATITSPDEGQEEGLEVLTAVEMIANWAAADGLGYAVLTENLTVIVNASSGMLVGPTNFTIDDRNVPHGHVDGAPEIRANVYGTALRAQPVLVWEAFQPIAMPWLSRTSMISKTNVLLTQPSTSSGDSSACVYALASPSGVLLSPILVEVRANDSSSIQWQSSTESGPLYSPYTLSYCTESVVLDANMPTASASVTPSATSLVLQVPTANSTMTAISIPLRDAVISTSGTSYGLEDDSATGPTVVISPIGSYLTFVCSQSTLVAYDTTGNLIWSLPFLTVPYCTNLTGSAACRCPSDSSLLTTSADQQYLFVHVTVESAVGYYGNLTGVLALGAEEGVYIDFFTPAQFVQDSDLCTGDPPTLVSIGPIVQVPNPPLVGTTNGFPIQWAGIATVPGTRCFVAFTVYCFFSTGCGLGTLSKKHVPEYEPTGSKAFPSVANRTLKGYDNVYSPPNVGFACTGAFLQGIWASFTPEVQFMGDSVLLTSTFEAESTSRLNTLGSTVMSFSKTNILAGVIVGSNVANWMNVYPTFSISNVIASAPIGALWFAVQVGFKRQQTVKNVLTLTLFVYEFTVRQESVWSAPVATYDASDPNLLANLALVSLFSLPRVLIPVVCVAASNVTCFDANTDLGYPSVALANGSIEYYGQPVVSDTSLMIFARDGAGCHALVFDDQMKAPQVLWDRPTWVGMDSGVDMDMNSSSCSEAAMSSEGLLLMCRPNAVVAGRPPDRRLYLLEARTGLVLLANGPAAMPFTAVLTETGDSLIFVSSKVHSSAFSLTLAGTQAIEPVQLRASFCVSGLGNQLPEAYSNYYLYFDTDMQVIRAIQTPWSPDVEPTDLEISHLNSSAFPLAAQQFRGFRGIALGITYTLEGAGNITVLLSPALPAALIPHNNFGFIRGQQTTITSGGNLVPVASSGSCAACDSVSCPTFCTVNITTGDQYIHLMKAGTNSFNISIQPTGQSSFTLLSELSVPFSGNASLAIARQESVFINTAQIFSCAASRITNRAYSGRYCIAIPGLSGKSFVSIEIASGGAFASVSNYAIRWGDAYYASLVTVQPWSVWMVGPMATIAILIQNAMANGAFPTSMPDSLSVFTSVANVDRRIEGYMKLIITMNSNTGPTVVTLGSCDEMTEAIPNCPSVLDSPFDHSAIKATRSVYWQGQDSNWGGGFVSAGFPVAIPTILRNKLEGRPMQCGGDLDECYATCYPTAECGPQLTAYFSYYLQTYSMQPLGSTALLSASLTSACELQNVSIAAAELASFRSSFFCTKDGNVTITTQYGGQSLVVGSFKSGVMDNFLGVQFTCSDCTYFMYYGIISQPIGWIVAGALKSLVITLLFYLMLDRIRANNRLQTRLRSRHRQLAKRLQALEARLQEHGHLGRDGSGQQSTENPETAYPEANMVLFNERRPVRDLSDSERDAEHQMLALEVERTRERVKISEEELSLAESRRWACTRWLPNPIALYSSAVIRVSGIRHPSERSALFVRVQDGLSSKEVSEQQLVDTLMHVTGEVPADRHMVEAFSHYYQWNMCLNRQVVIRDHIDESAHVGAPIIGDMLDQVLAKTHTSLRSAYQAFRAKRMADCGRSSLTAVLPAKETTSQLSSPEQVLLHNDAVQLYTPTDNEPLRISDETQPPSAEAEERLKEAVDAYVGLIPLYPQCFEYVALPSRSVDDKLMPNTPLLLFSIAQFVVSIIVYYFHVDGKDRAAFDVYQCIYFMAFNSSTPSALLVGAVSRADLGSLAHNQTLRTKLRDIFTDIYVWLVVILFLPPLVTHVIPGIVLYSWLLVPPLLLVGWLEYFLRRKVVQQTKLTIAARFISRILVLFVAAMVFTLGYNYSAVYLYSSPEGYQMSGAYRRVGYAQTIVDDYNARSIGCLYQHIVTSASNFLQAGFASFY